MIPNYSPITLDHLQQYRDLLQKTGCRASDYSFGNIMGWGPYYGLEWWFDGQLCWLKQRHPTKTFWAPVGDWNNYDWQSCECINEGMTLIRVPERLETLLREQFPGRIQVEETRGQWDYLYSAEELTSLSGNKFHKKKNLFNQFKKIYDFKYSPLTLDCVESVLDMQTEWYKWREVEDSPSLEAENTAIKTLLELWDSIPGLIGGAIRVDNKVVAYTVGEFLSPDTMVVHFEKGMPDYKGIYQAINQQFTHDVSTTNEAVKYMNREQDMGDEGLRKAKESYNPVEFVKKNTVTILPK